MDFFKGFSIGRKKDLVAAAWSAYNIVKFKAQ